MKILITTDAYDPMINGVVVSIKNLYRELKAKGHDVRILALSDDGKSKVVGDVYYTKSFDIYVYPSAKGTIPIERFCKRRIEKWQPDIIHSQTEFFTLIFAKKIAKTLNIPIIHTYHTMYEYYTKYFLKTDKLGKPSAKMFTKQVLNSVDALIAPTDKVKDTLSSYNMKQPIFIIPTGIDLDRFENKYTQETLDNKRIELGISKDKKIMVTVGRIGLEKNLDEIADNLVELTKTNKDIVWLVVGDGPYLPTLKERIIRLHLEDNVVFTGMVKPEEVPLYYKISDVYVNASFSETQGLTYIEALSSGIPLLCRRDECIQNILVEGENGYGFTNQEEFLSNLLSILKDENTILKFKENASKSSYQFSAKVFAEKAEKAYINTIRRYKILNLVKENEEDRLIRIVKNKGKKMLEPVKKLEKSLFTREED